MNRYGGAVLFIDILGIGALTRGKVRIEEPDYAAWKTNQVESGRHHVLGAKLLMQFRRSLLHTQKTFDSVNVAQLSDCAFLWSEHPVDVANAARELMWHVTRPGMLCRAGLAYGQIIEPDKVNRSLGQFILGEAVTKAVDLERSGKGARIFCDSESASQVLKRSHFLRKPFIPLKNPLDGSVTDEFRWYVLPKQIKKHNDEADGPLLTALSLVELLTILRYSPRLGWSATSTEGRLQIACTIEAVSQVIAECVPSDDYLFAVEHLMEVGLANRSAALEERVRKKFTDEITQLVSKLKKHGSP
jgi:hypothetical protein